MLPLEGDEEDEQGVLRIVGPEMDHDPRRWHTGSLPRILRTEYYSTSTEEEIPRVVANCRGTPQRL